MPTVSVVIPLYNAEDVIGETVETVRRQTWRDYEIIVVDDGSTDGSGEVVRRYADVRYLAQPNGGVASARNRGIREARGEYVALLDHDDLWHERKLERQVTVLQQRSEVVMVITDVGQMDRTGRVLDKRGLGYDPADRFARLFVRGYVPTPSAALIRRHILRAVGGFDERFRSAGLDDHELWTRIATQGEIHNVPEVLTWHRHRTAKPPEVALAHRSLLWRVLLERCGEDPEKRRYLLREQAAYFNDAGKHLMAQGRITEARVYLARGLWLSITSARSPLLTWRGLSRLVRSYGRLGRVPTSGTIP